MFTHTHLHSWLQWVALCVCAKSLGAMIILNMYRATNILFHNQNAVQTTSVCCKQTRTHTQPMYRHAGCILVHTYVYLTRCKDRRPVLTLTQFHFLSMCLCVCVALFRFRIPDIQFCKESKQENVSATKTKENTKRNTSQLLRVNQPVDEMGGGGNGKAEDSFLLLFLK